MTRLGRTKLYFHPTCKVSETEGAHDVLLSNKPHMVYQIEEVLNTLLKNN